MSREEFREDEPYTRAAARPLQSWRRHWLLGTVIALVASGLGVAAAFALPATYTAEARVAVGSGDLTSSAIAGFPLAASQLASNYARYVNDRGVANTDVPAGVDLAASQIPESNVIRIEATSADPEAARSAANAAAEQLIAVVNDNGAVPKDEVFDQFTKAAEAKAAADTALAAAQHTLDNLLGDKATSKAKLKAARADVTDAAAAAAQAGLQSQALQQRYTSLVTNPSTSAILKLVRTADGLASNRTSLMARLGLLGLVVGGAAGLLVATLRDRRRVTGGSGTRRPAPEAAVPTEG